MAYLRNIRNRIRTGQQGVLVGLGLFLLVLSVVGLGVAYSMESGSDDLSRVGPVESTGYAVVSDRIEIRYDWPVVDDWVVTLGAESDRSDVPVFVGYGLATAVEAYLEGVEHTRVSEIDTGEDTAPVTKSGYTTPEPPADQEFWADSATGLGRQTLEVAPESGDYRFIVMNADARQGVSATVHRSSTIPRIYAAGAAALALSCFLIGALLVYLGMRDSLIGQRAAARTPGPVPAHGAHQGQPPAGEETPPAGQQEDEPDLSLLAEQLRSHIEANRPRTNREKRQEQGKERRTAIKRSLSANTHNFQIAGGVLLLLAAAGTWGGAAVPAVLSAEDSELSKRLDSYEAPGYAVVTERAEVESERWPVTDDREVTLSARSDRPDTAIFIGYGPADDVDAYLQFVPRTEIIESESVPGAFYPSELPGDTAPAPPETQNFWAAAASGLDLQNLDVALERGDYRFVVMNADASAGVATTIYVSSSVPMLYAVLQVALGVVLAVVGTWLVIIGLRSTPEPPAAPSEGTSHGGTA